MSEIKQKYNSEIRKNSDPCVANLFSLFSYFYKLLSGNKFQKSKLRQ